MHYKDTRDGKIYGYKKFDSCVELTAEEFETLKNPPKTQEDIEKELIAHYKSLYLAEVDKVLKDNDYDSLATVELWIDDAKFGAEALSIKAWYKQVIAYNYTVLNEVKSGQIELPSDEDYVAGIPKYGV